MVTKANKQNAKSFKSKSLLYMYVVKIHPELYLNKIILVYSAMGSLRCGQFGQAPAVFQGTLRKKSGTRIS